jgi:CheY-like chemotaxis protein
MPFNTRSFPGQGSVPIDASTPPTRIVKKGLWSRSVETEKPTLDAEIPPFAKGAKDGASVKPSFAFCLAKGEIHRGRFACCSRNLCSRGKRTRVNYQFFLICGSFKLTRGRAGRIEVSLRILIADDEPQVRSTLQKIIERHEGWVVCGEAADGVQAIEKAAELKPNLILLDISMPNLDGLSALPRIREQCPKSEILILTLHESLDMARASSAAGAWGYVAKSLASTELVHAMESVEAALASPRK